MTWFSKLIFLMVALSCCFLCATVFLLYQYKQGIPYPFSMSLGLAAAVALVVPLTAVALVDRLVSKATAVHLFSVFCGVSLAIAIAFGVVIF